MKMEGGNGDEKGNNKPNEKIGRKKAIINKRKRKGMKGQ
jgi:hypothetical protein